MVSKFNDFINKGLRTLGTVVDGAGTVIRSGDNSIKSIDDAIRGKIPPPSPSQAFQNIYAHLTSMREMARGGYAGTTPVAQKAREIIALVNQVESPWSTRPSNIKTQDDVMRMALRDLQKSQALRRLATARGTADDINALVDWMNQVSGVAKSHPLASEPESETTTQAAGPVPKQSAGVPGMGRVTTEATIEHQHKEMRKHMLLLEGHLQQGCKIGGIACDCCQKHPIIILGLAEEAIGMVNNPVYKQIMDWCVKVTPITTEKASASGKYDGVYPDLASELRNLRKSLPDAG